MLRYQLQRFAGEKTERATPHRRREAKQEGQIPKSADLTSAVSLVAILIALRIFGPKIWSGWFHFMQSDFASMYKQSFTTLGILELFNQNMRFMIGMLGPILVVALVIGLVTAFAQVGPVFLPKLLIPDFKRVWFLTGFKRMFSLKTLVEAAKSVLKLAIVGGVAYAATHNVLSELRTLVDSSVRIVVGVVAKMIFQLTLEISVMLLVLAALDFLFQRFDFERSIRMSKEEIKQEMKNQDGDPLMKSQIRQRGRALANRRMMQDVPKADVIVTNPTHYAVAIVYRAGVMSAPEVVAKGQDQMALQIREVATDAGVPLVENKALARSLYRTVEIGQQVPEDFFQAVAEVLAYVYGLKSSVRR